MLERCVEMIKLEAAKQLPENDSPVWPLDLEGFQESSEKRFITNPLVEEQVKGFGSEIPYGIYEDLAVVVVDGCSREKKMNEITLHCVSNYPINRGRHAPRILTYSQVHS